MTIRPVDEMLTGLIAWLDEAAAPATHEVDATTLGDSAGTVVSSCSCSC